MQRLTMATFYALSENRDYINDASKIEEDDDILGIMAMIFTCH